MESAWAQLVSLTELESEEVPITKDEFIIGRNNDCDLPHPGNKLVSGQHCYIQRDDQGKVWLYDTSTNGTLLNLSVKLTKGECKELHHGDEIHIIHKKTDAHIDIGYIYQDMAALQAEVSTDSDQTLDYTQEMPDLNQTVADEFVNTVTETISPRKRKAEKELQEEYKRQKTNLQAKTESLSEGSNTKQPQTTKLKEITELAETEPKQRQFSKQQEAHSTVFAKSENNTDLCKAEPKLSQVSVQQKVYTAAPKKSENKDDTFEAQLNQSQVSVQPSQAAGGSKSAEPPAQEEDAIAENLICIICQEILHDCISLQPCMHSFCAGCYSEWMERSQECPSCRVEVARINKNHIVNNLVEAYFKVKPEKRRPEEELNQLNCKNKITRDMLYPVKKPVDEVTVSYDNNRSDETEGQEGSSDINEEDDEDDDDDYNDAENNMRMNGVLMNNFHQNPGTGFLFGIGTPFFGTAAVRPAQTVCRQCPGYTDRMAAAPLQGAVGGATGNTLVSTASTGPSTAPSTTTSSTSATPSTSTTGPSTSGATKDPDEKDYPLTPAFTCPINGNHVLCLCCMQPMPDRRHQWVAGGIIPPQQCSICLRAFCHAYWGCHKVDCHGCLARFQDLNFGKKCLTSLVLDNQYESSVLADYLQAWGMSVKDLFQECLARVCAGKYSFMNLARMNALYGLNTPVCYGCGYQAFKELAYCFRKDIPADQLPKEVTARPDCYWGSNCRTQRNKPEHAIRFNHICGQSRTAP